MAINNQERLFKAYSLLSEGLEDFVDDVMTRVYGTPDWPAKWAAEDAEKHGRAPLVLAKDDVQVQLRAITEKGYYFKDALTRAQQGYGSELKETRNSVMHGQARNISSDDAARALDTMERLLMAVGSGDSAKDVRQLRLDLQRTVYEDQTRKQAKRASAVSLAADVAGLQPWRNVIKPHNDVARGDFNTSEFAADLHLVHTRQALGTEYGDPVEFFSRTYLTEGLSDLLSRALGRLSGNGNASPVVNLQTNFGGGKTHSMLALYHLFSGTSASSFPQEVQDLVKENGSPELESLGVRRVALVGTYLQAASPLVKEDGTEVRTLWGELAWQLGGREAYDVVAADDAAGTNPGAALRTLLQKFGPALILIDEWVAYARQLVTDKELPSGSFDTQFTFAQSLTEIVKSVPGTMLVVSIPASDTGDGSGNDVEIGGHNGQLALDRLQNVIRRVADQWRPSSRDESFEIVRRRLFQNPDAQGHTAIAATARSFVNMYRNDPQKFPRAASANDEYEKRIRASYPLHPELLDRLYEDWSTLERFQRTRGVLKLVSAIIHELWASDDASPLILSGNVPLDASTVNTDLTQYLEDQWKPIIDSDIDGPGATSVQIDKERTALGQRHVTQRIARTIFMGAAPRSKSSRKGLDKQYVWLGAATPGDTLGNFGSAVDQLSQRSTYFYEEQEHYWFDTQPSVVKTARDFAERLREDSETVWNEIIQRLRSQERARSSFDRVHVAPESSAEIPDLEETRLVLVHPRHSRHKQADASSPELQWVRGAIESKGASQRVHRNSLVFVMADRSTLEGLEATCRDYLGWKQVQNTSDNLNLTSQQRKQTDGWVARLDQTMNDKLQETYSWAVFPEQTDAAKPFELSYSKISSGGGKSLPERVSTKLAREGQLVTELGASILGSTLHQELRALWDDKAEISVGELWGYFTRYVYMPRLMSREVLDAAVDRALHEVLVEGERFAVASGKDSATGRYLGLALPNAGTSIQVTDGTLLVSAASAESQIEQDLEQAMADRRRADGGSKEATESSGAPGPVDYEWSPAKDTDATDDHPSTEGSSEAPQVMSRYFGSVRVDAERYARDIGNVMREVIDRLAGAGAELEVTIDIQASKSSGFDESEIRTISENSRTLKFETSDFEQG